MQDLVEELTQLLLSKNMILVTAESCTGGLLSATLTHKAGASRVFDRGFVTYSNQAKTEMLGVSAEILETCGAVSPETAEAMADGALANSPANLAVSITGIAGPDGGSDEKPVGLVYFGYALEGGSTGSVEKHFTGNRQDIQTKAAQTALKDLIGILRKESEDGP